MPRLAIVIPAIGSIPSLEATLVSVLENRPHDCEIIVVLNQAYDDPYQLKDEVRFVHLTTAADRRACVLAGVAQARSAIVHLLESGCEVSEAWTVSALEHFDKLNVGAVAPVVLDKQDRQTVLTAGIRYGAGGVRRLVRAQLSAVETRGASPTLGPSQQAAFYRKSLLEISGVGFGGPVGDQLADVELALAIRAAGYVSMVEPQSKVYASPEPPLKRGFRQALHAERLFWRNAPVVGWFWGIICHVCHVTTEVATSFPSLTMLTQPLGRAVGCFDTARHRRHHVLLRKMAEPANHEPAVSHLRLDRSHSSVKPADARDTRRKAG